MLDYDFRDGIDVRLPCVLPSCVVGSEYSIDVDCPRGHTAHGGLCIDVWAWSNDDEETFFFRDRKEEVQVVDAGEIDRSRIGGGLNKTPMCVDRGGVKASGFDLLNHIPP